MVKKYVCNPKTGRVIEVGGSTYKEVSKNAAYRRKLMQSPKSSSKDRLKPCPSPRKKKSPNKLAKKLAKRLPKKSPKKSPKKYGDGSRTCTFWHEDLCKKGLCPKGKVCSDKRTCVTPGGKRWVESGCTNPLTIQQRRQSALAAKRRYGL